MKDVNERFGKNLKLYRMKLGISQRQFAEELNINQSTISQMESGEQKFIMFEILLEILGHSGEPFEYFLKELNEDELQQLEAVKDKRIKVNKSVRARRVPKVLYYASRIEMRNMHNEDGFHPRIDLFHNPEDALDFVGGPPMDVYTIKTGGLPRGQFEVVDHPLWPFFSYHDHISKEHIVSMVTHR